LHVSEKRRVGKIDVNIIRNRPNRIKIESVCLKTCFVISMAAILCSKRDRIQLCPKRPVRKNLIPIIMFYKLETIVYNKYSCNSIVSMPYRLLQNVASRLWLKLREP
jgi:hypothetical protein